MANQNILLVEDEKDIAEAVEHALKLEGFEVTTVYDGEKALAEIFKEKPDLVVLDIILPKIDGWEVLSTIRRQPSTKSLPVVVLTAKTTEVSKLCGFDLGADDYLTKPFSVNELLARIKAVLKRSQFESRQRELAKELPKIPVGKKRGEEIFVSQEDILYIKAVENYTYVYTAEDNFLTTLKMYELEEKLAPELFIRPHRSYIVNLRYVQGISQHKYSFRVELKDDERTALPISRAKVKELKERLGIEF